MEDKRHPVYGKFLFGSITIVFFGIYFLVRGVKNKVEFNRADGRIEYLDKVFEELPFRDAGKYRYLKIDGYSKVFEIFIGKEFGDFSPKFEKLDELKVGEDITVFYDINEKEKDIRLNRTIQYIDKDDQPYFIIGNKNKIFGIGFIVSGLFLLLVSYDQFRKGKII
jgi:hypothetical protein